MSVVLVLSILAIPARDYEDKPASLIEACFTLAIYENGRSIFIDSSSIRILCLHKGPRLKAGRFHVAMDAVNSISTNGSSMTRCRTKRPKLDMAPAKIMENCTV